MKKVYVLILLSFFILLSACGSQTAGTSSNQNTQNTGNSANPPAPGGYLATGSNYVLFIQFTNTNGILSGEWDEADETTDNPPQVRTFNSTFSANLSGTQFNLTLACIGCRTNTFAGSFDGSKVTIEFPQTDGTLSPISLSAASIDNYNNAVRQLQKNVSQQDQKAADNQATAVAAQATAKVIAPRQNDLNYDLSHIGDAISNLNSEADLSSVLKQYSDEMSQMQSDYQKEQSDAKGGCSNYGTVGYDDGTVQYDEGSIQYTDGSLQYQNNSLQSDLSNVQAYIQTIQKLWNELGQQASGVSQNDINTSAQNGVNAINQAKSNQQSPQNQPNGFANSAKQIVTEADNLYNKMHC